MGGLLAGMKEALGSICSVTESQVQWNKAAVPPLGREAKGAGVEGLLL